MKGSNFPEIDFESLTIPPANLKIVRRDGVFNVFDRLRKNYFRLTKEEFIRQNFVSYLIEELNYPASLMANEIGISLNGTRKRCDTVVFSKSGEPLMIIEYKSPNVAVTQEVFDQIVRYNMALKADFLVVSNGIRHFCCRVCHDSYSYKFLPEIPDYLTLLKLKEQ